MTEHYAPDDHLAERTLLVAAAYVVLRRGGDVLLQLRQGTGYMDGRWALLAGHVDRDEPVDLAAAREAREEGGVVIDPADLVPLTTLHRLEVGGPQVEQRADFFYACDRWSGEPSVQEPDKCAEMRWFPLDALPDGVVPHERLVLDGLRERTLPAIIALPATSGGWAPVPDELREDRGPARRLEVDGEVFEIRLRPDLPQQVQFDWVSGPNPDYGFGSGKNGPRPWSDEDLIEAIRHFLRQIDSNTGYIED